MCQRPFVQSQGSIRSQYGTWRVSADGDQSLLVVGDKTYKAQQPLSEFVELAEGLAGVYGEGCEAEFDLYTEKALQEWAESNAEAIDTVSIGGSEALNEGGVGSLEQQMRARTRLCAGWPCPPCLWRRSCPLPSPVRASAGAS